MPKRTLPLALLAALATGTQAQVASLTTLGLPAMAVTPDGRTILLNGGVSSSPGGALWTELGATPLSLPYDLVGLSSDARAVAGGWWGAYRFADGATTLLPGLVVAPYSSTRCMGISGDGRTVFGRQVRDTWYSEAMFWDAQNVPHGLGFLPGRTVANTLDSEARAASYDGAAIAGLARNAGNYFEAFRWTQATGMVGLGSLAGTRYSAASAMGADGRTIFGTSYDYTSGSAMLNRAFRWTAATGLQALDGLGDVAAVTPDGRFAVGCRYTAPYVQLPRRPGIDFRPPSGWRVTTTLCLWDARKGTAVDLNALTAPHGLETLSGPTFTVYQSSAPDGPLARELYSRWISGVAYEAGRLTVVGAQGRKGFRLVLPYDPASLRIAASLDGFRGDRTALPVAVELREAGSVVQRTTVFPEADGRIVVNAPAAGTYDVSLSAPRFLRRTLKGVALSGGATGLVAALVSGDVDGNGVVNAADRAKVTLALGTVQGQSGFSPLCDLDGNGVVNAADRALATLRLGSVGDQ